MKTRNPDNYHIESGSHHPLTHADLLKLATAYRESTDEFTHRSIGRRITQGIPGMTYPAHIAPSAVRKAAGESIELFRAHVNQRDPEAYRKLCDLLAIEWALPLQTDWHPAAAVAA